jgi:hypothetical protein
VHGPTHIDTTHQSCTENTPQGSVTPPSPSTYLLQYSPVLALIDCYTAFRLMEVFENTLLYIDLLWPLIYYFYTLFDKEILYILTSYGSIAKNWKHLITLFLILYLLVVPLHYRHSQHVRMCTYIIIVIVTTLLTYDEQSMLY